MSNHLLPAKGVSLTLTFGSERFGRSLVERDDPVILQEFQYAPQS